MTNKVWHCAEWYFDTPKNEARFWWNGQERPRLHWVNNKPDQPQFTFPDVKAQSIGWAEYQGTKTPYESYIDEIAIDPNRIGCDQ